jgi:excisionase family DNA binding protein
MTPLLYTPKQAAHLLGGCSENHVRNLIARGQLRAVDIAPKGSRRSKTRVRHDDLQRYVDQNTRSTT